MNTTTLLTLISVLVTVEASELNAWYHKDPGDIGSLCSGLTLDQCNKQIPYVLVHSVVECAIRCTKQPRCKSFNYQHLPNSPGHTHRCEMTPHKTSTVNDVVRRATGYQYYNNVS